MSELIFKVMAFCLLFSFAVAVVSIFLFVKVAIDRKKIKRAIKLYDLKRFDSAISLSKNLLNSEFKEHAANVLADCYFNLKEFKKAKRYYETAIKFDSENPLNYLGLASVNIIDEDFDCAIYNLNIAIDHGYDNTNSKLLLSICCYLSGRSIELEKVLSDLCCAEDLDFYLRRNQMIDLNSNKLDLIRAMVIDCAKADRLSLFEYEGEHMIF